MKLDKHWACAVGFERTKCSMRPVNFNCVMFGLNFSSKKALKLSVTACARLDCSPRIRHLCYLD